MDNELYSYDTYRGFNIYAESYLYDNGETGLEFSGEIYKDSEHVDCGKIVAMNGAACLELCMEEVDWMLEG